MSKELLVKKLTNDVETMKTLSKQEKEIFKDEETTRAILFHPMLHIVTTMEEIKGLRKIEDLQNMK